MAGVGGRGTRTPVRAGARLSGDAASVDPMSTIIVELYDALKEVGASDKKARAAALGARE
jgi:dissimilatory sulfite reductase (desulfoviridin) alpha/beta subunit